MFKFDSVRCFADAANTAAFLCGILIISAHGSNQLQGAVIFDFLANGLAVGTVQGCDNYLFYNRFLAVTKVPLWKKITINIYIILALFMTWIPAYIIVPFFYNVNDPNFTRVLVTTLAAQYWSTIAYNVYFTFEFGKILYDDYMGKATYSQAIKIISIKSIIHCMMR